MLRDGQSIGNLRGNYALVKDLDLVRGHVQAHADGFGFLIPDSGESDVFLSARQMRQVFNDDQVLVRVTETDRRGRREGVIVRVLERHTKQVVGRYICDGELAYIDPDHKAITQDIIIPKGAQGGARHGQYVVAKITAQPELRRQPTGEIVEVLGDALTPGMEVELAIRSYDLPFTWSSAILADTQKIAVEKISEKECARRLDLRKLAFVTIDGEDAKDFDDAVYCEKRQQGWRLYVAIADVSYYVKPDSSLDKEAVDRGNSVYFPSRVIPMLPEILSNGLCSLKPQVDRLVMVCQMELDAQGAVKDFVFKEGVIHSHARLTYTQVAAALQGENSVAKNLLPHLKNLQQLYKKLHQQREIRGAIDFDMPETKIIFDNSGKIDRIAPTERNEAHKIIEECMLLANICAAKCLTEAEILTLYRNHEGPDPQKLLAVKDFLKSFGLRLTGGSEPTAKDYAKLLKRIVKREDKHLLQMVMLRSLRRAIYSVENKGHFGLSYPSYCHFTSPIRRYPDLLVHRALKHLQQKKAKKFMYDAEAMNGLGEHFSFTERRADQATYEAIDWLKCDYMQDKLGKVFSGVIGQVTGFGLFIELKDIYVEGLLHISALKNDYYQYDATHHTLTGRRSGRVYRLGDPIEVLVARVDLDERKIDFELV